MPENLPTCLPAFAFWVSVCMIALNSPYMSVCFLVYLIACLYVYLCVCMSIFVSGCLYSRMYVRLSNWMLACLAICLPSCLYDYLLFRMFESLYVSRLSVCMSVFSIPYISFCMLVFPPVCLWVSDRQKYRGKKTGKQTNSQTYWQADRQAER